MSEKFDFLMILMENIPKWLTKIPKIRTHPPAMKKEAPRRRKLAAQGLFDAEAKQDLPFLPDVIGVLTSPTGAVIRDILHRLADRFPRRVLLWPVLVQGEGAAEQVSAAIRGFNELKPGGEVPRPDVLIVARGGGSLEDLWAFNEEAVVRAAADSDIPLISAVGHETDTTLIDFAADQRAPTPTAAAEMAVPVRLELLAQVRDDATRLMGAMTRLLDDRRVRLEGLARGLPNPQRSLEEANQKLDDWSERLRNGLNVGFERKRTRLSTALAALSPPTAQVAQGKKALAAEARALGSAAKILTREKENALRQAASLLKSYSYENTLKRGFALIRDAKGRPLMAAADTRAGQAVDIQFHDGKVEAVVTDGAAKKAKSKPKSKDDRQGELL